MKSLRITLSLLFIIGWTQNSCIVPDDTIKVVARDENAHPVRIVEAIGLSDEAHCACDPDCVDSSSSDSPQDIQKCPIVDETLVPHLFEQDNNFCACSSVGGTDQNPSEGFRFFIEDQDVDDDIYVALLLNYDRRGDPRDYLAYENASIYDPRFPISTADSRTTFNDEVILRPPPHLRSFLAGDPTGKFDLCDDPLVIPGDWNVLTVLVTDREFFRERAEQEESGETRFFTQDGVPDIASGATYDTSHHVFFCYQPGDAECDCGSEQ